MRTVYIYFVSMLLIRTYFCPVVVNPDFLQNHMVLSLTLFIIHIVARGARGVRQHFQTGRA